jgi:hypothetical protein
VRVGFDYWNVISHYPAQFGLMAHALIDAGHEVFVISAIGRNRLGTITDEVTALGVPFTEVHEIVFSHPRESPALKTAKALKLDIDVFYDDRDDVCRAMAGTGKILALRVTRPGRGTDTGRERA